MIKPAQRRRFTNNVSLLNTWKMLIGYRVVLAITKADVEALPTLFKTYDSSAAFDGCTIWEVARATSAATTFFESIKVGRDGIDFIDAGFGYNNPCDQLIWEARQVFGELRGLQVLSIGTGLRGMVDIKDTRMSIMAAMKKMATSSEKVAASLEHRYGGSGQYFRFSVDRGLEDITLSDWAQAGNIASHTKTYLYEQSRAIDRFVNAFTRGALPANKSGVNAARSQNKLAYAYSA